MNVEEKIVLKPIGVVNTKAVGKEIRDKNHVSKIILQKNLIEALDGIEDFSHIFVIFWLHKISNRERETLKVHPRARQDIMSCLALG